MPWIVAVHKDAKLDPVAVADTETEAEDIAKAFSNIGRTLYWRVKEMGVK